MLVDVQGTVEDAKDVNCLLVANQVSNADLLEPILRFVGPLYFRHRSIRLISSSRVVRPASES